MSERPPTSGGARRASPPRRGANVGLVVEVKSKSRRITPPKQGGLVGRAPSRVPVGGVKSDAKRAPAKPAFDVARPADERPVRPAARGAAPTREGSTTRTETAAAARALTPEEQRKRERALSEASKMRARQDAQQDTQRDTQQDAAQQDAQQDAVPRQDLDRVVPQRRAREETAQRDALQARDEPKGQQSAARQPTARQPAGAEETTRRPDATPRRAAPKTPARPGSRRDAPRRRDGHINIDRALAGEERRRSLSAMRRRQARARGGEERPAVSARTVVIPDAIAVQDLAARMAVRAQDLIQALSRQGMVAKAEDILEPDIAQLVAEDMGAKVRRVSHGDVLAGLEVLPTPADAPLRAPVVAVMGHVDHGKTTLLDALRSTDTASGEAGGITQGVAAWRVRTPAGATLTFLDTPGHEAFSAMRARGAQGADIVALVVAADDGVMPQTEEAIAHARESGTPIVAVINKCDVPGADVRKARDSLVRAGVILEGMGGDVLSAEVSAKEKQGLDKLLEVLALQSELMELRADEKRPANGVVVEARVDKGRGRCATVLVREGVLRAGAMVVVGSAWGRARGMKDEHGAQIKAAGPSHPVELWGLTGEAEAGDPFYVVESEARARAVAEYLASARDGAAEAKDQRPVSVEAMFAEGTKREERFVIKADAQGGAQALAEAIMGLAGDGEGHEYAKARILLAGAGALRASDLDLARASDAHVFAFRVAPDPGARKVAQRYDQRIYASEVIYDLLTHATAILSASAAPRQHDRPLGAARVQEVFALSNGRRVAAGCLVEEGAIRAGAMLRVMRDGGIVYEGPVRSLRRFREEAQEARAGQECGITLEGFKDVRLDDVMECFERTTEIVAVSAA